MTDAVVPSAVPDEDDIRRWQALPRDEQISRLRQALSEAEASGITSKTMDDIKAAAKERLATMGHG